MTGRDESRLDERRRHHHRPLGNGRHGFGVVIDFGVQAKEARGSEENAEVEGSRRNRGPGGPGSTPATWACLTARRNARTEKVQKSSLKFQNKIFLFFL